MGQWIECRTDVTSTSHLVRKSTCVLSNGNSCRCGSVAAAVMSPQQNSLSSFRLCGLVDLTQLHICVWLPDGMAALHCAASRGHVHVIQALLDVGASAEQLTSTGSTALHQACQFGHATAVQVLLKAAACRQSPASALLPTAAETKPAAPHKQAKVTYNAPSDLTMQLESSGCSPQALQCNAGGNCMHSQLAAVDGSGLAPLHLAVRWGHMEVAKLLLAAGSQPNQRSYIHELTPAHVAARWGHVGVLQLLCMYGADMYANDAAGGTVLDEAIKWGRKQCIQYLQGS